MLLLYTQATSCSSFNDHQMEETHALFNLANASEKPVFEKYSSLRSTLLLSDQFAAEDPLP